MPLTRVTSEDYFRFLYPHENYFDMWHYEFLGIVDEVTMQLNKGGKWPTLWRCKLWKFLEANKVHLADYISGNYTPPAFVDVLSFEPCKTERSMHEGAPKRILYTPNCAKVEGFWDSKTTLPSIDGVTSGADEELERLIVALLEE